MLEIKQVTKYFPGVCALDKINLSFNLGEIHALSGENGAGKSTLIRIISGIYSEYSGDVILNGEVQRFHGYQDALNGGISIVNQEIQVIAETSIAENIMLDKLSRYRGAWGGIDWKRLYREAGKYMEMVEMDMSPRTPIGPLSAAQKQLVQIACALSVEASVLLFDEPTSSITQHETEILFGVMRRLRDEGKTIIFVSHKLDEIFRICDQVSVIRDGRHIGTMPIEQTDSDTVTNMMIGRGVSGETLGSLEVDKSDIVLDVKNLTQVGKVDDVSFHLHRGEILGFYGLVGAGRTETARLLIGDEQPDSGSIFLEGKRVFVKSVADALYKFGMGYVTENRKEEGLWLDFDVETNSTVTVWARIVGTFSRQINRRKRNHIARDIVGKLDIKITGLEQSAGQLSGGNQQKVSIAKWLTANCNILIIDEPTVGVDVGAKEHIHNLIWHLARERGISIILISSDLPEVIKLTRRILVFRDRKIVGELSNFSGAPADNDAVAMRIGSCLL